MRKLLNDYVQVRVDRLADVDVRTPLDAALRRSGELQADLLRHAAAVSIADPHSIPAGLFATSLSEMIDQQEVRLAAARNRVPPAVLFLLYGIALVGIGLSGYVGGLASRSGRLPHALMALMVATVIVRGQATLAIDRAAEFPAPDHQRIVQHAALLQVGDQRRDAEVR